MKSLILLDSFFNSSFLGRSFNNEERILSQCVYQIAREEVQTRRRHDGGVPNFFDYEDDPCFKVKIKETKKSLKKIIYFLNGSAGSSMKFIKNFRKWEIQTECSILTLRTLAREMNEHVFNCNVSTIAGSCTGLFGGLVLASSLLFPSDDVILAIGGIAVSVGAAITFGTSVAESALKFLYAREAKEVLSEEEKKFSERFKHSKELLDFFEKTFGFTLIEEAYNDLLNYQENIKEFSLNSEHLLSFKRSVQRFSRQMINNPFYSELDNNELGLIPIIVTFFYVIVLLRYHVVFSIIFVHRSIFGLRKKLDFSLNKGVVICNAVAKLIAVTRVNGVSKAAIRMIADGLLTGFGITLDVTIIAVHLINLYYDSKWQPMATLECAANQFGKEYNALRSIHNKLVSNYNMKKLKFRKVFYFKYYKVHEVWNMF